MGVKTVARGKCRYYAADIHSYEYRSQDPPLPDARQKVTPGKARVTGIYKLKSAKQIPTELGFGIGGRFWDSKKQIKVNSAEGTAKFKQRQNSNFLFSILRRMCDECAVTTPMQKPYYVYAPARKPDRH